MVRFTSKPGISITPDYSRAAPPHDVNRFAVATDFEGVAVGFGVVDRIGTSDTSVSAVVLMPLTYLWWHFPGYLG